jgi:predicted dehydrogenase
MGRAWLGALIENSDVELVGVVDLNLPLARTSLADLGHAHVPVGSTVSEIATLTRVDAVVNATVPEAHHAVNSEALFAGIPVLCEKPIAPTVAQAMSLAAASEATGQLLMTSQSRRYYASLSVFRNQVRSLGQLGLATTEFFKARPARVPAPAAPQRAPSDR